MELAKARVAEFCLAIGRRTKAEQQFLLGAGLFAGSAAHLDAADNDQLTVDALSVEAVATSEIAGEILDRATVQSSIRGLPINDSRRI
jgi:hypothetical protein